MIIKITQLGNILNCCDIHSISKNQYQVILARYHNRSKFIIWLNMQAWIFNGPFDSSFGHVIQSSIKEP